MMTFWMVFAGVVAAYVVLFALTLLAMRSKKVVRLITKWSMKMNEVFEESVKDL